MYVFLGTGRKEERKEWSFSKKETNLGTVVIISVVVVVKSCLSQIIDRKWQ